MLMRSIFMKSCFDKRWALLGWSIGLVVLSVLVIAFYPSFGKDTEALAEIAKSIPPQLSATFGRNFALGGNLANYLQGEMMGLNTPMFVTIMCISLGVGLLASDEDKDTLAQLIVRPVSRTRVVFEKWLTMVVISLVAMVALVLATFAGAVFVSETLPIWHTLQAYTIMWLLGLCFGTLAVCVGAISGSKGLSIGLPAAWAALTYLLYTFGLTIGSLEKFRYVSWWYYYSKDQAIINGAKLDSIVVLSLSFLVLLIIGLLAFSRRDINTH